MPKLNPMMDLSLDIIRTEAQFLQLRDDWWALEELCDGAILFQSFNWCRLAARVVSKSKNDDLFVCCVYSQKMLVGVLPLRLLKKRFYTVLTGLAEPFQEFSEMLVAPGISPGDVWNKIWPNLASSGADCIHLGQVRKDSRLFDAVNGTIPAVGEIDAAPFVPLDQWDGYDAFLKTVKTKTRKNMRNQRNVLERTALVEHLVCDGGDELDQVIERTYANRAQWLAEKGLTSAAFSDDQFQSFLGEFKSDGESGIDTLGMSLMHGDKLIAEQWGFIHRDRYYAFISSYDEEYARLSPGKLHLGEVIKTGFEKRLKAMEFMLPDVPYKRTWAKTAIPVQDHIAGFTTKGKLYAGLWVDTVRPRVKRLFLAIPESLRRPLMALAFWR